MARFNQEHSVKLLVESIEQFLKYCVPRFEKYHFKENAFKISTFIASNNN